MKHAVRSITAALTNPTRDAFIRISMFKIRQNNNEQQQWISVHLSSTTYFCFFSLSLKQTKKHNTFQLAQGVQRHHAITTAPVMMDMLGQESAAATAASMGLRVSCVYQADTAPTANVRLSFLSILLPTSSLSHFVSDRFLSKPKNSSSFQCYRFSWALPHTDGWLEISEWRRRQ